MSVLAVRPLRHLLVVLCLTLACVGLPATAASASSGMQSFDTPGIYDWTVPAGVTQLNVEVWGASGLYAYKWGPYAWEPTSGGCGLGGYAQRVIAVTPGETLGVVVGRAGDDSPGLNGGGAQGGGDASDLRQGGTSLTDRAIVAGGGGGLSQYSATCAGNGGDPVAPPRTSTSILYVLPTGGTSGTNATEFTGGKGGQRGVFGGGNGGDGSLGHGGAGGAASSNCWPQPGGGGGGGYYGGGGGGGGSIPCAGPYLGGSSLGGGGSSFAPGGTTVPGVWYGNGLVILSYGSSIPSTNCSSGTVVDAYTVSSQGVTFEVEVRDRPEEYEVCASLRTPSGMAAFDEHHVVKKDPTSYIPTYTPPSIDENAPDGEAPDSPCPQRTTGGSEKNGRAYLGSGSDAGGNTVVCAGFRSSTDQRHTRVTIY